MTKVAIVMGSRSDLRVMRAAAEQLEELGVASKVAVVSAHRTPRRMVTFAEQAEADGFEVIIAGAGGAAHLPGMVASLTDLPVIGVPIVATPLNGLDALFSIAQMPAGVPVATVAVENARNAALLAARILAVADPQLRRRLHAFREAMRERIEQDADALELAPVES